MNGRSKYALPLVSLWVAIAAEGVGWAAVPPPNPQKSPAQVEDAETPATPKLVLLSDAEILVRLRDATVRSRRLGEIASGQANRPDVRRFGEDLVGHAKVAVAQVKAVASKLNVSIEWDNEEVAKHEGSPSSPIDSTIESLKRLRGSSFDEAFVSAARADREWIITSLNNQVSPSAAKELHELVKRLLPTFERERAQAERLVAALAAARES